MRTPSILVMVVLIGAAMLLAACGEDAPPSRPGASSPADLLARLDRATAGDHVDLGDFATLLDERSREQLAVTVQGMMTMGMVAARFRNGGETDASGWGERWREVLQRNGYEGSIAGAMGTEAQSALSHALGGATGTTPLPIQAKGDSLGLLRDLDALLRDMDAGGAGKAPSLLAALRVYQPDRSTLQVDGDHATARGRTGVPLRMKKEADGRWFLLLGEAPLSGGGSDAGR